MRSGRKKRNNWAQRQAGDPFVKKAARDGYRSRAAYKLEEIDVQDRLLKPGMSVVELGAAPGGWSQYVSKKVGPSGRVIAVDLLDMANVQGCTIVKGDFTVPGVRNQVTDLLPGRRADLVISDMAPNISGIRDADEARFAELFDAINEFCRIVLRPGGTLLVKMFQGPAADGFRRELNSLFRSGQVRKPRASRSNSREYYFLTTERLG